MSLSLSRSSSSTDVFREPGEEWSSLSEGELAPARKSSGSPSSESPSSESYNRDESVEAATKGIANLTLSEDKPLSTSEKRRRLYSQAKNAERLIPGIALNIGRINELPPQQRAAIALAFEERKADLESSESSSSSRTSRSPILTPRSVVSGSKAVEKVQAGKRDAQLLDMIEKFDNQSLRNKFSFYNESIMSTDAFFEMILNRINSRLNEDTPESLKCISQLLYFCIEWLDQNRGTKLVPKAEKSLSAIIQATKDSSYKGVKTQSAILKKNLTAALENKQPEIISIAAGSYGKSKFSTVLDDVASGTVKPGKKYEKLVKKVAEDLFQMQIHLFCKITKEDLVQKWQTASTSGAAINNFSDSDNALFEYIIEKIIFQKELSARKNLMKFFLDVGYSCLKLEDHQSASCIYSVLSNAVFDKLPQTSKKVHAHKHYLKLKEFFNGDQEFEALRARRATCEKEQKAYIPYVPLNINDFIVKEANHPSIVQEVGKDSQYNIRKLTVLRDSANDFLAVQERLQEQLKEQPYQTDFIEMHIRNKAPHREGEKDANATLRKRQAVSYQELKKQ